MRNYNYLFALFLCAISLSVQANVPNVVVTTKPIHSLVSGVMFGLKTPTLLLSGKGSPHIHFLKPNEVRQINAADIIVWVGPSYETFLCGILGSLKNGQHIITLVNSSGMILYPIRQGGMWGHHNHSDELKPSGLEKNCTQHDHEHLIDGHIWLDPENAKTIVKVIADKLSILDPIHEEHYRANAEIVMDRLTDLDREITQIVSPIVDKPYLVFHDGTQYFDRHFKTRAVGVLIGDSHYGINAQHLLQISEFVLTQKVRCVFTEPQFSSEQVYSILDKTGTRIEVMDYLGVGLKADQDAYFIMMRNLAHAFASGLAGS